MRAAAYVPGPISERRMAAIARTFHALRHGHDPQVSRSTLYSLGVATADVDLALTRYPRRPFELPVWIAFKLGMVIVLVVNAQWSALCLVLAWAFADLAWVAWRGRRPR